MASDKPTPYAFAPTIDGKKLPWELGRPDILFRVPSIHDDHSSSSGASSQLSSANPSPARPIRRTVHTHCGPGLGGGNAFRQFQLNYHANRNRAQSPTTNPQPEPAAPVQQQHQRQQCTCDKCPDTMPSKIEKKCCMQEVFDNTYIRDFQQNVCILNCVEVQHLLSPVHLELSWLAQRQYQGFKGPALNFNNMNNNNYRYHAYRSYIGFMHGRLGRYNRRVVPACLVKHIREQWPADDGSYKGYIEVDENGEEVQADDELEDMEDFCKCHA